MLWIRSFWLRSLWECVYTTKSGLLWELSPVVSCIVQEVEDGSQEENVTTSGYERAVRKRKGTELEKPDDDDEGVEEVGGEIEEERKVKKKKGAI